MSPPWTEFARAPLVPVAVAVTLGLLADRYGDTSLSLSLGAAAVGLVGWAGMTGRKRAGALHGLWLAFAELATAYPHPHRNEFPPDDIGTTATVEPRIARVRGVVLDEPVTRFAAKADPLAPRGATDRDTTVLRVTALGGGAGAWVPPSGKATLSVERESAAGPPLGGIHAGDSVEVVGVLTRPRPPGNPGESDYASYLLDQRIRAEVRVSDSADAVVRLGPSADPWATALARARGWAAATLTERLAPPEAAVARALLLGDTAAMDRSEWDVYVRTGVVHALAISGQHLLVLAAFAWFVLKAGGVRRRRGAWAVGALVVGYAVLTGLRPSGLRAAVMVAAVCGAWILRRPLIPANAFALGWLAVVAMNPTDPFSIGCQLSFLSVFVLVWGLGKWLVPKPLTPLEEVIEDARPLGEKLARDFGKALVAAYVLTLTLAAVNMPLLVAGTNLASPVGVLVGPPVVLLTSVALVSGFLLIVFGPFGWVAAPFAWVTEGALALTGRLVHAADVLPGGAVYLPPPPTWWLVGFYALLAGVVLGDRWLRIRLSVGLLGWVLAGLLWPANNGIPGELRVTFLAVGAGGCTVVETPDGRCLVYDAGTTTGPTAVRRVVAPYLWHRGVTRIDELFLSHADADHFNGVAELFKRFPVAQVTLTPSFAEKPTREVAAALLAFEAYRVPVRVAVAGDRFRAGDVALDVLHPPANGPPGIENERSLVLAVRYAGATLLLTGDLEKAGTARVLELPRENADVLMSPHHGARGALPAAVLAWANPRLVVACRGPERGNTVRPGDAGPAPVWDTWTRGAVTVRCHPTGIVAEDFRTGEVLALGRPGRR